MVNKFYPPWIGGIEKHLYILCQELKNSVELKVLVANTRFKTDIEYSDGYQVVKVASLGVVLSTPICIDFYLWLKRLKSDIIHFHFPYPVAEVSYMLGRSDKRKVVVTYHTDIVRQKKLLLCYGPVLVKFLRRADMIIVTSPEMMESSPFVKRFRNKCVVIPFGIDIDRFRLTREVEEKIENIKARFNSPIVLFVGRLVYYKGLGYLIKAMREIDAVLLIIGEGGEMKYIRKLAREIGVIEKIYFLGAVSDTELTAYYYASDVFVLPSVERTEAFGIVQLEAHACGRPVVSTRLATGVTFANLHGITGIVVPPRNPEMLSGAINELLKNDQLRVKLGQQARERVEREFTKELMSQRTLELYKRLVN